MLQKGLQKMEKKEQKEKEKEKEEKKKEIEQKEKKTGKVTDSTAIGASNSGGVCAIESGSDAKKKCEWADELEIKEEDVHEVRERTANEESKTPLEGSLSLFLCSCVVCVCAWVRACLSSMCPIRVIHCLCARDMAIFTTISK
jgi:hypothetical protein